MTNHLLRPPLAATRLAIVLVVLCTCAGALPAQSPRHSVAATVDLASPAPHAAPSSPHAAVFWLQPLTPHLIKELAWTEPVPFRLLQKNRMFSPHMLVVPAGATVTFPNADPFFHNVFSLFDGKRFDLGLYEAGTSRNVRFERPGISYIFCNIHPEMSAVVIALQTRLYAVREAPGQFLIPDVPEGEYEAHLWVEGEDDRALTQWTHRLTVTGQQGSSQAPLDAGTFHASPHAQGPHANKFGQPYRSQPSVY